MCLNLMSAHNPRVHVVIRDILVNECSELEKISASFTKALMIFKLMNLHNTPWGFFMKPQDVSYKRNKNLNERITSLLIKVSINYADMQEDS